MTKLLVLGLALGAALVSVVPGVSRGQEADSFITAAKGAASALMKDPGSAQFQDLKRYNSGGTDVLCGSVNAKNAYGGYVGFRPFVVLDDVAFLRQDYNAEAFDSMATHFCTDKQPVAATAGAPIRFESDSVEAACAHILDTSKDPKAAEQCLVHEPAARLWAEGRLTTPEIAAACNREGQLTGLYFMARLCVEREESASR